jgi:hypothetical protein
LDAIWLKSFEEVQDAIESIQSHFEVAINDIANEMKSGQTIYGNGNSKEKGNQFWWEGFIDPPFVFKQTELSYACGASTLTGIGKIDLKRNNDIIDVLGVVRFEFNDPYDWHSGKTVPIGFFSTFKDCDMILLEEYRGAKPFDMKSTWNKMIKGTIEDDTFSPNEINLNWSDL